MERSPLNRLPAELRLNIYEFALTLSSKRAPALVRPPYTETSYKVFVKYTMKGNDINYFQLALTQTCRAIRHETSGLFYKLNIFRIVEDDGWEREFSPMTAFFDFLDHIGPQAISALRDLQVEFIGNNCICMNDDCCLDLLHSTMDLRKWCLKHPHVALSALFIWPGEGAFAIMDLQSLDHPVIRDVEDYLEDAFGGLARLQSCLEGWKEALRALTLAKVLKEEAEEA